MDRHCFANDLQHQAVCRAIEFIRDKMSPACRRVFNDKATVHQDDPDALSDELFSILADIHQVMHDLEQGEQTDGLFGSEQQDGKEHEILKQTVLLLSDIQETAVDCALLQMMPEQDVNDLKQVYSHYPVDREKLSEQRYAARYVFRKAGQENREKDALSGKIHTAIQNNAMVHKKLKNIDTLSEDDLFRMLEST